MRQLALLQFRNTIVLSVKLDDALSRPRARVPPSITQMLLILQVATLAPLVIIFLSIIAPPPTSTTITMTDWDDLASAHGPTHAHRYCASLCSL